MAKVMVGILQAPTAGASFQSLDYLERLNKVVIPAVDDLRTKASAASDPHDVAIFAAPEYTFSRKNANQPVVQAGSGKYCSRGIDEADKEFLLGKLAGLTKGDGKLLLIPGTVAWLKPFDREKGIDRHKSAAKAKRHPGEFLFDRDFKAKMNLWKADLGAQDQGFPGYVGGQDYGGQDVPNEQQKENLIDNYTTNNVQMLRNSLYVMWNGKILHKYNKVGDYHEVLDFVGQPSVFVPGDLDRQTAELFGKTFGFEICLDHAYHVLDLGTGTPLKDPVDCHVLLSASVDNEYTLLKSGGLFIHASSDANETCVARKNSNGIVAGVGETVALKKQILSCEMRYFKTEMDLTLPTPWVSARPKPATSWVSARPTGH